VADTPLGLSQPSDTPNPRLRSGAVELITFINPLEALLVGKDKQFTGAGQWKTYDWTNPSFQRFVVGSFVALRTENEVWRNRLTDLLKSKDLFYGPAGVGPDFDWLNPVGHDLRSRGQPSVQLKTWTVPLSLQLLKQDKQFTGAGQWKTYDYPNPVAYDPRSRGQPTRDVLNFLNPVELALIGQDQFFGAAGETKTHAWPNPPSPTPRAVSLLTWIQFANPVNFQGREPIFSPRLPAVPDVAVRAQGDVPGVPLALTVVVAPAPFAQTEWANPQLRLYASELRTWTQSLALIPGPPYVFRPPLVASRRVSPFPGYLFAASPVLPPFLPTTAIGLFFDLRTGTLVFPLAKVTNRNIYFDSAGQLYLKQKPKYLYRLS
jgi:hypothetical protein